MQMGEWERWLVALGLTGAAVAIGRALSQEKPPKIRIVIGRMIVGGVLGMAASSLLVLFPDAPQWAVFGAGCALVVGGEQTLEALVSRFAARRMGGDRG